MPKVTVRDVILANVFAIVVLLVVVVIWTTSAMVEGNAITVFHRPQPSSAEAFYKVGRFDLLRDTAVMCESSFNKLVVDTFQGQIKADGTTAAVALCAIAMLLLNVFLCAA